ncbi:F510_1955 family glycosylhydrolase [Gottfriedia acidiceleris]|uniref:VPS10, VPS10 domain protein n=1 Tax=Gottfriedia acidiceleris TaxID=371036 RepID=A0ABY4JQK6_9BACI|nr:VPS10, VPS10 domain protein [Gottfriedia acidiceleris]UPM56119.1 VPS10, VPS10 domain protein [Gottfriedia acidiceleris]
MQPFKIVSSIIITSLFLSACSSSNLPEVKKENRKEINKQISVQLTSFYKPIKQPEIDHIHGIGYTGNIEGLTVATHHGLKVFSNNKWYETKDNNHDYMGFQAISNGFYSSGHPEEGSNLKNPLGLLRSTDGGKTIETIDFYGMSDFHNLAVGYNSHSVLLFNQEKNDRLDSGFYFSEGIGKQWKKIIPIGLPNSLISFSIHTDDTSIIAMNTKEGLYLSKDKGNNFVNITPNYEVTASTFTTYYLYYAFKREDKNYLGIYDLSTKKLTEKVLPEIDAKDMISFLTVQYNNEDNITFSTMNSLVYTSSNQGNTWIKLN